MDKETGISLEINCCDHCDKPHILLTLDRSCLEAMNTEEVLLMLEPEELAGLYRELAINLGHVLREGICCREEVGLPPEEIDPENLPPALPKKYTGLF